MSMRIRHRRATEEYQKELNEAYLNKSEEAYFEPLQKGRKDGLKMYGENPTPEQKEPEIAAAHLRNHPYYQQKYLNKK